MASEGGGKLKQKRNQTPSKPYERKSSLFGKLKDSVKDLLIPSWLSGSPSTRQEADNGSTSQAPNIETRQSGRLGPIAPDWSHGNTFQPDRLAHGSMNVSYGNSSSGKLSSNIPGFGLQTPNGELGIDKSPLCNAPAPNLTIMSHVQPTSLESSTVGPAFSRNSGPLADLESEDQRHPGVFEVHHTQEFEVTPIRPIMVSTGLNKSSSSKSDVKRQRLWSPEPLRQGKPLVPPVRGKPAFSSLLFCTPSKMDSSTVGSEFGDSSFYVGKTRFGGALSKRKDLNTSLPYQSSLPLRKQVKATKMNSSFRATTSSTAQRILDTLERMSTPLEDAKKIPQGDQGNDSVLSFTPSSYRRQSSQCSVRPITRPLQLPNRGPPTSQLQSTSQIDIARNRDRSRPLQSESVLYITQEAVSTKGSMSDASSSYATNMGKMKTKKFSQHISGRQENEVTIVPNLRTDFTLPVSGMTPITLSSVTQKSSTLHTAAPMSTKSGGGSPLKFTFSTPIEEKNRPGGSQLSPAEQGFKFSSPIHVSPHKTSAAGAEEGSKSYPEPAVGAATPLACMWSAPQMVKPKAMSPDIGGTSSSFKSYTKWSGSPKNDVPTSSPAFGVPSLATSLKKGSVMDILGGGKSNVKVSVSEDNWKTFNASESSQVLLSQGHVKDSFGKSNTAPLSDLFKKSAGMWECDTCMIQNNASDNVCAACSARKPGSKPAPAFGNVDKPLSALFKKPEGSWECGSCMVPNDATANKCIACSTPKPGSKPEAIAPGGLIPLSALFKKSEGSWECDACMIQNTSSVLKCVACETPKPGAKTAQGSGVQSSSVPLSQGSVVPLSAMFKKPEGSWECDACMIQNSSSALKCVACETPKPGAKTAVIPVANKSNNSLASMFKKPEGSWECDTCMVQNSSTSLRCAACDTAKPGLQSAGIVSKPSSNTSQMAMAPGGGFTFNLPSTTTTTIGSAGFKFGNTTASVISSDAAPLKGGFSFGHNSSSNSSVNSSDKKTSPLTGGFQFGTLASGTSVSMASSVKIGASVTSSADSTIKGGFTFNESSNQVNLPTSQSLPSVSSTSVCFSASKSTMAAATGGFQFGSTVSTVSTTVPVDKKSETSVPSQPTFTFGGAAPPIGGQASSFVFGAPVSSAPNVGLGMGQSLATSTPATSLVNGGFGSSLGKTDVLGSNSGFSTGTGGFTFGAKQPSSVMSSSQHSSTTKRSVDSAELGGPSAKINPAIASVSKEPAVNGGFNFNNGGQTLFGPLPTNAASLSFGSNLPSQPGGFNFSATNVSTNQPNPAGAFSFSAKPQSGQDPQAPKKNEVSFGAATSFNFSATPDGNAASSVFQFGAKPEASANKVFSFGAAPNPAPQSNVPVFGASGGSAGMGSFNIGSTETSQRRVMKKAVRRIKPRT